MRGEKPYFVDLFAGCGGLSLGLENAGFVPAYVNEIDHSAMETYLRNRDKKHPLLREKHNSHDIRSLTHSKNALNRLVSGLEEDYGIRKGDLALVVGGPPCQGYSAVGMRRTFPMDKKDIPSNYLYRDMIKVIEKLQPKAFLFENVAGLMRGRWTPDGRSGEIWNDVQKAFTRIGGYEVRTELIHAKSYGVPQNRPRIIMVGVRDEFKFEDDENLTCNGLLPEGKGDYPDLESLLSDLVDPDYEKTLKTNCYLHKPRNKLQRDLRTGSDGELIKKGDSLTEQEYSKHSKKIVEKFQYMLEHGGKIPKRMKTKKFAQRVLPKEWNTGGPNITATSLPDDYVHYSQPRSLTVREWARLQTFPDWYEFSGKRTTGGRRRAGDPSKGDWSRETPKYTQIGNAVPVKLAEEIGKHLKSKILV
jgi:DNA (cytosine-5)-methyltransferase 1